MLTLYLQPTYIEIGKNKPLIKLNHYNNEDKVLQTWMVN
jgi:hypothetical protein